MSIRLKTIFGIAIIEALVLALLVSLTINYLKSTNYDGLEKRANTTANLFASTTKDAVLSYDLATLESFSTDLVANPDIVYVRVLSFDQQVLASAGNSLYLNTPFELDKEVALVEDGIFDTKAYIQEGGETYGAIELGLDTAELNRKIEQVQQWSLSIALSEMALVALFSFLLGTYLTNRLNKLKDATVAISEGSHDIEIEEMGKDEVSQVIVAFNEMTKQLKIASQRRDEYEQELKSLNQTLESRVERRTHQLSEKVEELNQSNTQLRHTQERLVQSEKLAALGTLAAGVAHEINNPIGFIMSNIRTLKQYTSIYDGALTRINATIQLSDQDAQQQQLKQLEQWLKLQDVPYIQQDISELLTDTLEGTERIKDIVAGLHEFSSNERQVTLKLTNLNDIVNQTLKLANNKLSKEAEIIKKLSDIPDVMAHAGHIQQILFNLIINASQAVGENGKIKIQTGHSGNNVYLSVTDNGCGIPDELQKQIFDPFFTTKAVGKGTGLGLSIAYGIAEEHGGQLKVQSAVGKGSRFTLLLPKAEVLV